MRSWMLLLTLLAAVWTAGAAAAADGTSIHIRVHQAAESEAAVAQAAASPGKKDCEVSGVRLKHRSMRYYGENAYVACSNGKAGCYLVERVHDRATQVSCPTERLQAKIDEEERYRASVAAADQDESEDDQDEDDEYKRRHRRLSLAVVSTTRIWDGGVVCYQLNEDYPFNSTQQTYIYQAMTKVEASTNVRFVSTATCESDALSYCDSCANWVDFKHPSSGRDCNSSIGITDEGAQIMNLADRCFEVDDDLKTVYGSAMHEIGHSLGLYHEHQHPQRTIGVFWDDIDQDIWSEMAVRDVAVGGAYDIDSVMHYPMSYGFCQPTYCSDSVTTDCVDEGTVFCNLNDDTDNCVDVTEAVCDVSTTEGIGQRIKLSDGDIEAINELYQSAAWSASSSKVGV
jgi:hypothetical protein